MDQGLINGLVCLVCGCFGWFGKALWDKTDLLRSDLDKYKEKVAESYVPNGRFNDVLKDIRADLNYIKERVDSAIDHRS